MARRYYRGPKKKADDLGRLLIVLKSRHQVWIPCSPEDATKIGAEIHLAIQNNDRVWRPEQIQAILRVESIEAVQYFPHKQSAKKESE